MWKLLFNSFRLHNLRESRKDCIKIHDNVGELNLSTYAELIQQSLDSPTKKQEEEEFLFRMESVDPINTSIFSTMSSWNNLDEFRFGRRQNSHNPHSGHISDMIRDLDLMISELDGERGKALRTDIVRMPWQGS